MISLKKKHFTMASFRNVYTALLLVIARSIDWELARQVSYLKSENQILRRRLPERLILTQWEKSRLVRFAKNLGSAAFNQLSTSVHPGTIRRWIREAAGRKSALQDRKSGRQRTAAQIEKLILKLAADNGWAIAESSANCANSESGRSLEILCKLSSSLTATTPALREALERGMNS